jgi:hypothetical protein
MLTFLEIETFTFISFLAILNKKKNQKLFNSVPTIVGTQEPAAEI